MRCQVWNDCCSECVCLWRERKFQARMTGMFRMKCVFRNFGFRSRCWRFGIPLFFSKSLLPNLFIVNRLSIVSKFQFLFIQVGNIIVINILSPSNMRMHQVSVITNWVWVYPWLLWIPTWSFLVTLISVTVIIETTGPWQDQIIWIRLHSESIKMSRKTWWRQWMPVKWVSLDSDGSRCYFILWCNSCYF